MRPLLADIPEFAELEPTLRLVRRYRAAYGAEPLNLSHWDPSPAFGSWLLQELELPPIPKPVEYVYPYEIDSRFGLLRSLGFDARALECLITPSGTASSIFALAWLRNCAFQEIFLLSPYYFPVYHQARLLGLHPNRLYLQRAETRFRWPAHAHATAATLDSPAAFWITNPVFSTGWYFDDELKSTINSLLHRGHTVVLDECLAIPGRELGPKLDPSPQLLCLYSPHKSIPMNALKFSALVLNERHWRFFGQWADIMLGGLGASNLQAVMHFQSDQFLPLLQKSQERLLHANRALQECARDLPALSLDNNTFGHFVTCYYPSIAAERVSNVEFLWRLIKASAAYFMSGVRSSFPPEVGLCFRINLTIPEPLLLGALTRLSHHLGAEP